MDTEPLSPDAEIIINNNFDAFKEGIKKVSFLTKGKVFICKKMGSKIDLENFETHSFDGPHPAGLAGTHMHFLDPPSANKTVWSIGYQDVISIGKLFLNGLTELTPEVAEILAAHRGWLHLGGLRSISPAVARALSKHQGWLFLNGIRVLKKDVAIAILPYRGQLYLDGVETITEEVAEIIAQRRHGVELYGVQEINYQSVAMLRKNSEIILPSKFNRAGWWPF